MASISQSNQSLPKNDQHHPDHLHTMEVVVTVFGVLFFVLLWLMLIVEIF